MVDVIDAPPDDKFQIITEHAPEDLNFAESYLRNHYSNDVVFIQITLNSGRSVELKKALYKRIFDDIGAQLEARPDDVVINLVEVPRENWSYGGGIAQYVRFSTASSFPERLLILPGAGEGRQYVTKDLSRLRVRGIAM